MQPSDRQFRWRHTHTDGERNCHTQSELQVEDNGVKVDDTSIAHGGGQRVITPEGYIIPLDSHGGLMHVPIRPFTDTECGKPCHM